MNKFIKEQLNKCHTPLPEWNETTTQIAITGKNNTPQSSGNVRIHIESYIINEPNNFTLSSDWNNNTVPPEQDMNVEIVQQMGKMYKVSGEGISTNIHWEGWIPQKSFKVV